MQEFMNNIEFDTMKVIAQVEPLPIKPAEVLTPTEEILDIVEDAKKSLTKYTHETRGTCMDERPRVGSSEVRPSAPGGPDVYGLAVAELIGYYTGSSLDGNGRAKDVKQRLDDGNVPSGGHKECAADNLLGTWAGLVITDNKESISSYVQMKIEQSGKTFNSEMMQTIFAGAQDIQDSGRYADWTEESYFDILGDEKVAAVETLADVPHLGKLMLWTDVDMYAIDQTAVNNRAFELNKPYMQRIENVIANGPNASHFAELAEYARYSIVKALSIALPNTELHEGIIK